MNRKYRDKEWLSAQRKEGRSVQMIADECNATPQTIYNWLYRFGLRGVFPGGERSVYHSYEWLRSRIEQGKSVEEMAVEANASLSTIYVWLRRHDLFRARRPSLSHQINFNVTRETKEWLTQTASEKGMSLSKLLRTMVKEDKTINENCARQ